MYQIVIVHSVTGLQLIQSIMQAQLPQLSFHPDLMASWEGIGKVQSAFLYFCSTGCSDIASEVEKHTVTLNQKILTKAHGLRWEGEKHSLPFAGKWWLRGLGSDLLNPDLFWIKNGYVNIYVELAKACLTVFRLHLFTLALLYFWQDKEYGIKVVRKFCRNFWMNL